MFPEGQRPFFQKSYQENSIEEHVGLMNTLAVSVLFRSSAMIGRGTMNMQ